MVNIVWHGLFNKTIIELGPLQLRWYGIMYLLTFLISYYYMKKKIGKEKAEDIAFWLTIFLLIGARLGMLFYEPKYYLTNPIELLKVWKGGMSFHGGLIGILLGGVYVTKKHQIKYLELADILVVPLALGQTLGRLGNFINGELYGRITTLPWAMQFPGAEGLRHPSQLYEATYDLIIFGTLLYLTRKPRKQGTLLAVFLIMYAIFRFSVEFVREPDLIVGGITMGQWLCIPMLIGGIALYYYANRQ